MRKLLTEPAERKIPAAVRCTLLLAVTGTFLAGCTRIPPGAGVVPGKREQFLGRVLGRVNLLANPRYLGDDYAVPDGGVRQIFAWGPFGAEWRIFIPGDRRCRVGFRFTRSLNFRQARENNGALVFNLYPRTLDSHLALRVHTAEGGPGPACILCGRSVWGIGRWGTYRIPLKELENTPDSAAHDPESADCWAAVTAIELEWTNITGEPDSCWVVIRNLELGGVRNSRLITAPTHFPRG
ncbi:MAG: hypothetical protein DRP22_01855 [Verrucomicrobia bacterium]|nr:MAG: hypothetical protein DRP22_01855 [Verrucomicrobiota bacterium]